MLFHHLRLLIIKSLRYAWRQRACCCCPKILFELLLPLLCLLLLLLIRWTHSPAKDSGQSSTQYKINPSSISPATDSKLIFSTTSSAPCPGPDRDLSIKVFNKDWLDSLRVKCPNTKWKLAEENEYSARFSLTNVSNTVRLAYYCDHWTKKLCENASTSQSSSDDLRIEHPSKHLCASEFEQDNLKLLANFFSIQSIVYPPKTNKSLEIYSWPCRSYATENLFSIFSGFFTIVLLIMMDGSILYSFNVLMHAILDEKHQGITELLRLISVRPILNSVAWFLRVLTIQLINAILLIIILRIPIQNDVFLRYTSLGIITFSIVLWTIQTLSRSVVLGHLFQSNLKASLWSWFTYGFSFWLAVTSMLRLPFFIHCILSAWFPFYSIKRLIIFLIRFDTEQGHLTEFLVEVIYIWFSMLIGIGLMWLFAYYLDQVRPGKYGVPRPWSWPIDALREYLHSSSNRRSSIHMDLVETTVDGNVTVRVNDLTKTYGHGRAERQVAVNRISFKLEKSKIHGLIGHNGSGKTTTIEIMCGLLRYDSGNIEIHEKDLHENLRELRAHIGYCPQQDMLFSHLTAEEQLEFYASVRSEGKNVNRTKIRELLTMMEMGDAHSTLCHNLSGGMQRKLSILCAFAGDADVILLDEPSSSLDPVARRILWSWLRANKKDRTLLISSHLLDEVEELCDSIIILDSGVIKAQGTVLELKTQYGPSGDQLHLTTIPSYIPKIWIVDERKGIIQIPDRQKLIDVLERLENDQIKYSLDNITLDDIFIRLTSSSDSSISDETSKTQIETIFKTKSTKKHFDLWLNQILAVLIRRSLIFLRRARLLPILLILYLIYALSPLYLKSINLSEKGFGRYIISTKSEAMLHSLSTHKLDVRKAPWFNSTKAFEEYLSKVSTWQSDYQRSRVLIGIRINSDSSFECFVPVPKIVNSLKYCLPLFSNFTQTTSLPIDFLQVDSSNHLGVYKEMQKLLASPTFYCFHTIPLNLHFSLVLISLSMLICGAMTIQDGSSNLHAYALIHGLHSIIHWLVTYVSDLLLCLVWLTVLILIDRFIYPSAFDGLFFALTPLFYVSTLPFIYLFAKFFNGPILGATVIVFLLHLAHFLNAFKIIMELFRGYQRLKQIIFIVRWLLIAIFPNVNAFTLIVAILRPRRCQIDGNMLPEEEELFTLDRYPNKVLIHTLIMLGQILFYFVFLVLIDNVRWLNWGFLNKIKAHTQEEDNDVASERERIETMNEQERGKEALVVDNLSKHYWGSKLPAVNRLTFAASQRECFGLLGFNGSGKTTTFRMLVGDLHRTSGQIYRSKTENLGYCPQDDIKFSALTVLQSIDYICRIHGLNPSAINHLILRQFQLEKYQNRLVSRLSGGTCRRLHLALCLIGSPSLLLLDEPTAKVDPLLRAHIRLILQHRPIDTAIIFASHSMFECEQLCDRLTILVHGTARCLGSTRHLKQKYGTDYRVRLTARDPSFNLPYLKRVEHSDEYTYPKSNLSQLFKALEKLVQENRIESNYTVQLTSLEHIFLGFQHPIEISV